jgi:hypothetical protein
MATITSAQSGLFSAGSTWVGGVPPADNDTPYIAGNHVVEFDLDMTSWANGFAGVTISNTGTVKVTRSSGTYVFKLKNSTVINCAAGSTFDGGTEADPLPYATKITFINSASSATSYFSIGSTARCTWVGTPPTNQFAKLTSQANSGQATLVIDRDLTSDNWAVGDTVKIMSTNVPIANAETKVIQSITANSIVLTTNLTNTMLVGSNVVLVTRNIVFSPTITNGFMVTAVSSISPIFVGVAWVGTAMPRSMYNVGAVIMKKCCQVAGYVDAASNSYIEDCVFSSSGTNIASSNGITLVRCLFTANTVSLSACVNVMAYACEFTGNAVAVNSGATLVNCTFQGNTNHTNGGPIYADNCIFSTGSENVGQLYRYSYSESLRHNQVDGAFRGWSKGGSTTSVATPVPTGKIRSYQIALISATTEGWWERKYTVNAGQTVTITLYMRKTVSMSYLPRAFVFDTYIDPFVAPALALHTFTMTNSTDTWESDSWSYTNSTDAPKDITVRFSGMNASGSVYTQLDIVPVGGSGGVSRSRTI